MAENVIPENKTLLLDERGNSYLYDTRKWTMFIAIVGFVMIGLFVLFGLIALFGGMAFTQGYSSLAIIPMLIIMVIYFFPIYYLYKFSSISKSAIETGDSLQLTESMRYLKMHYTFLGILLIIVLVLYLIGIIFGLTMGTAFWMR